MKCENIKELIIPFSFGDLSESESRCVEAHLQKCKDCRSYLERADRVWEMLDTWEEIEPEGDFVARFWRRVSHEEREKRSTVFDIFSGWNQKWAFVASIISLVVLSLVLFSLFEVESPQVAFKPNDREDERILMELDRAISRDTAESLEIYGPWDVEIDDTEKGG